MKEHETLRLCGVFAHPDDETLGTWGTQEFYRAMSLVNGGRKRESDLFEGLR